MPHHRPRAPQPGPPVPPAPSTPVEPGVLMRIHIIAEPTPNFACNSPTTLSNPEMRSLELQRFQTLLKLHPIELHASFLRGGPRHRPRVPRPRRHTPRTPPPLPASLHERNTAPARHPTAWLTPVVKEISPMLAQNGQNTALFSVPGRRIFHGTPPPFTQGRLFFHLNPPYPTGGTKLALLDPISAQAGKNSPSTLKTPQNQRFFASRASFFALMGATGHLTAPANRLA